MHAWRHRCELPIGFEYSGSCPPQNTETILHAVNSQLQASLHAAYSLITLT